MKMRLIGFLLACCATGCSIGTPRDTGNSNQVALPAIASRTGCGSHGGSITVAYPQVPDALNTFRIALTDFDQRSDYFAGMRWTDFLPDSIQSALVESLRRLNRYDSVLTDGNIAAGRWQLGSDVRQFQAVYHDAGSAPEVRIEIVFHLRSSSLPDGGRRLVVSKEKTAQGKKATAIAQAFREAFLTAEDEAVQRLICGGRSL